HCAHYTYNVTRTWKATDPCGNMNTCSQTISVVDTNAPTLVGVPPNATVECNAVPSPANVMTADNCDPNPTLTFNQTSTQDTNATHCGHYTYTITRTWFAKDACDNTSPTATQVITVHDTTAPVITSCPSSTTVACPNNVVTFTPAAADNCDP